MGCQGKLAKIGGFQFTVEAQRTHTYLNTLSAGSEQAACTKKGREEGFKFLSTFIEEAKESGLVANLSVALHHG